MIIQKKWFDTKIVKFIKWLFIIFTTLFIVLLISIYISSLSSYKESDFNIPKDFFVTKFGDKDPYSEENWFNDFLSFKKVLKNKSWYFDILSKCLFDKKYIESWICEKDKENYFNNIIKEHDWKIDDEIRILNKKYLNIFWIEKFDELKSVSKNFKRTINSIEKTIENEEKIFIEKYNLTKAEFDEIWKYQFLLNDFLIELKSLYENYWFDKTDFQKDVNYFQTLIYEDRKILIDEDDFYKELEWFFIKYKDFFIIWDKYKNKFRDKNISWFDTKINWKIDFIEQGRILLLYDSKNFLNLWWTLSLFSLKWKSNIYSLKEDLKWMDIDISISNHFKSINKPITDAEIKQYKQFIKEKEELISKKYIKLDARKIRMLKDFYKVFDYINDEKAYGKYKEFIDMINKTDENIKTIADIWKVIDKINNWIEVNIKLKNVIEFWLEVLYDKWISLEDFKKYQKYLIEFEKEKEIITEKQFNKFKNFVAINKIQYRKINNKDYILQTPEYSWFLGQSVIFTDIIQYSRAIRYVAYRYFEEWKYENGINVLLEYQWFIDNLMNKYDSNLIWILVNFTINRINLEALEYLIDNYNLSNELKEKIKLVLEKEIDEWLTKNGLKWEYKTYVEILEKSTSYYDIDKTIVDKKTWKREYVYKEISQILKIFFLYSDNESKILLKKYNYDMINNNWKRWFFSVETNINNYLWRKIINYINPSYTSQFKKEQDLRKLRSDILEKLKP